MQPIVLIALLACGTPKQDPKMATTRDAALALAMSTIQQHHPDAKLVLLDETQGGGIHGPWVFRINADPEIKGLGPALVMYDGSEVEFIPNVPGPLRLSVNNWEKAKYGVLQR